VNDYERIARIIEYLDAHHVEQPDLHQLAGLVHLSTFHFHRLFSSWAGVTPKDFLQCLTVAHARDLLRNGESVMGAALDAGLSGPGRLHDLCVNLEAATPGEVKSGGEGMDLGYGLSQTPFGSWLVAESPRGLCHLSFIDDPDDATARLKEDWPRARLMRDDPLAERLADDVFDESQRKTGQAPLRAFVRGTPFQVRVWRALLRIPRGALTSYGRLAEFVGHPSAARAVGNAVGDNPLAWIIPCHRVIRETGIVGNYRWGRVRKRVALAWEGAQPSARRGRQPKCPEPRERLGEEGLAEAGEPR